MGRLGNQMFQFASTLGIAKMVGTNPLFPIENCHREMGNGPINLKTGTNMWVKCDILDCFEIPKGYFVPETQISPSFIYQENEFKFNPQVRSLRQNTDLYGYFQDERYFIDIKEDILNIFKFRKEVSERAESHLGENLGSIPGIFPLVSLHVRRGDYTLYPNHHPTCSPEYYSEAMSRFSDQKIKFLVFSDDIDWCRTQFLGDQFVFIDSGSPYSDLKIMTQCDHHIIANSSYSWWGAWLNPKENKRVIAPSRWFGPEINKDSSEIYCQGWEVI